jgi:hypothetical protein
MNPWEKAKGYVTKKEQILDKLAANTETQCRFIHKREMRGLGRVLGERAVLLQELSAVNKKLVNDPTWKKLPALAPVIREIAHKQQELLERSGQALQEAMAERALIATELKNNKINRQVKNGYVNPWARIAGGRFINEKG